MCLPAMQGLGSHPGAEAETSQEAQESEKQHFQAVFSPCGHQLSTTFPVSSKLRGSGLTPHLKPPCPSGLAWTHSRRAPAEHAGSVRQGGPLQRRVARSLSSPLTILVPSRLLMTMYTMAGGLSQLLSLSQSTLGPSLPHRDIHGPCVALKWPLSLGCISLPMALMK